MKITRIKTYKFSVPTGQERRDLQTGALLSSPSKAWLFVKVETDAGIDGWGEGTCEWLVAPVESAIHEWSNLLIGRDPLNVVALTEDLVQRLPWKGGPVLGTAASAINVALYDITAKAWGVPVHIVLGGKRRDCLRVYCGGEIFAGPPMAAQAAREVKAAGYAGVKGNPLESRMWPMDEGAVAFCLDCIAAIRGEVGNQLDILLDTHGSPQPELSIEFARRVAMYHPLFLEEPLKVGSLEALLEISRNSPVPIAVGEKLFTVPEFAHLIDRRACAFLQPDVTHCFGITTLLEIARRAEHAQMLMAPHNAGGPLALAASFSADAVINNFLIQEMNDAWFKMFGRYVEHDWQIKDGYINISDRPGLGVQVKEADIAKLPYESMPYREYHHRDGSWKGW